MVNLSTLLIALFITIAMVPLFRRMAYKFNAMDQPDARKVHTRPMARTGGLAIAVGVLVPLVLWAPPDLFLRALLLASSIIVAAGFVDDLVNLGPGVKLGAQVLAALVIIFYGRIRIQSLGALMPEDWLLPIWVSIPLTLIVVVGVTNAINLADGLDGLAGGISMIAFIVLGYLSFKVSDPVVTLVAAAAVGAIFGFLRFNTYPATIFMGDSGSQLLGFLAIVLALQLTQNNVALSPTLPLLFLGFPILDTLTVMLARIYHGRSPFSADKNHFHHKLMRLGLHHSEAVLTIYLLQVVLVLTAYHMRYCSDWMIVSGYLIFAAAVTLFFFLSAHFNWYLKHRQKGEYNILQKRLAELNKLTSMLKVIFRLLQMNFVLVLLIIIVPTEKVPSWLAGTAAATGGLLLLSLIKRKSVKFHSILLRLTIYLTLPILIYNRAVAEGFAMVEVFGQNYALFSGAAFFTMILLALLLLKFTRRSGYKSTPLDFLILAAVLLVPVIAPQAEVGVNLELVAVQMIALFFTFEVIIEESRRRNWWLDLSVIGCMLIIGLKWLERV